MKEISKISIVISFLALWITSRLETDYQTWIGFAFIFSFGILHGANDLILIKNFEGNKFIAHCEDDENKVSFPASSKDNKSLIMHFEDDDILIFK